MDARGVGLEAAYVNIVLDACKQEPQAERLSAENFLAGSRPPVAAMLWEFLDEFAGDLLEEVQGSSELPCAIEGQVSPGMSCGIGGIAVMEHDETRELRAWKLFSVLPFWLLLRPGSQGRVARDELLRRFNLFEEGHWDRLHAEAPSPPTSAQPANFDPEQRAKAACQKVRVGEVSRAR